MAGTKYPNLKKLNAKFPEDWRSAGHWAFIRHPEDMEKKIPPLKARIALAWKVGIEKPKVICEVPRNMRKAIAYEMYRLMDKK